MRHGSAVAPGEVNREAWDAVARQAGVRIRHLIDLAEKLGQRILNEARALQTEGHPYLPAENIIRVIGERLRCYRTRSTLISLSTRRRIWISRRVGARPPEQAAAATVTSLPYARQDERIFHTTFVAPSGRASCSTPPARSAGGDRGAVLRGLARDGTTRHRFARAAVADAAARSALPPAPRKPHRERPPREGSSRRDRTRTPLRPAALSPFPIQKSPHPLEVSGITGRRDGTLGPSVARHPPSRQRRLNLLHRLARRRAAAARALFPLSKEPSWPSSPTRS